MGLPSSADVARLEVAPLRGLPVGPPAVRRGVPRRMWPPSGATRRGLLRASCGCRAGRKCCPFFSRSFWAHNHADCLPADRLPSGTPPARRVPHGLFAGGSFAFGHAAGTPWGGAHGLFAGGTVCLRARPPARRVPARHAARTTRRTPRTLVPIHIRVDMPTGPTTPTQAAAVAEASSVRATDPASPATKSKDLQQPMTSPRTSRSIGFAAPDSGIEPAAEAASAAVRPELRAEPGGKSGACQSGGPQGGNAVEFYNVASWAADRVEGSPGPEIAFVRCRLP